MENLDWRSNIDEIITAYKRDGAVIIRNAIPPELIVKAALAVEQMASTDYNGSMKAGELSNDKEGRFFSLMFPYNENPAIAEFLSQSDLPEIAAKIMESNQVRYFFNHLLIKNAKTNSATPWHQDRPYWPVTGKQILGIWIPFDY